MTALDCDPGAPGDAPPADRPVATALRTRARWQSHWLFAIILAVAVGIRVVMTVAYRPAIIFPDSLNYLLMAANLTTGVQRQTGYGILIAPLMHIGPSLTAIAVVQHLLFLVAVVAGYALLIRRRVPPWLAALGVAPLALDVVPAYIEQFVMSDTFANALLILGLVLLLWDRRRPPMWAIGVTGLIIGVSVVVRVANVAVWAVAAVFVVVVLTSWRTRIIGLALIGVTAVAPVVGYASLYHSDHGKFALSGESGVMLYSRVSQIIDCPHLTLPSYETQLCPEEPLGQREQSDYYAWSPHSPAYRVKPATVPEGMAVDKVRSDFVTRVILQEPLAYSRSVAGNVADLFSLHRGGGYFVPQWRWLPTTSYPRYAVDPNKAAAQFDDGRSIATQPEAGKIAHAYGRVMVVPGPLLAAFLLVGLLAGFGLKNRKGERLRILAITLGGLAPVVFSAMTVYSSMRYQVLAAALIPAGAALAISTWLARGGAPARPTGADR